MPMPLWRTAASTTIRECIERIVDSKLGNTIVDNTNPEGERVISSEVASATGSRL